jgi:hypothetical protein
MVLDIRHPTDSNPVDVTPYNRMEPEVAARADLNVTENNYAGGEKDVVCDPWLDSLVFI